MERGGGLDGDGGGKGACGGMGRCPSGRTPTADLSLNASGLWVEYCLRDCEIGWGILDVRSCRCRTVNLLVGRSERRRTEFIGKVTCLFRQFNGWDPR